MRSPCALNFFPPKGSPSQTPQSQPIQSKTIVSQFANPKGGQFLQKTWSWLKLNTIFVLLERLTFSEGNTRQLRLVCPVILRACSLYLMDVPAAVFAADCSGLFGHQRSFAATNTRHSLREGYYCITFIPYHFFLHSFVEISYDTLST